MLIGLDLGTTNIKALLVEEGGGRILCRASAPVQLLHVGEGAIEQDIEEIWSATLEAIRRLDRDKSRVRAIGVSAQGGALQMADAHGRAVGRVVSWLDGRFGSYSDKLTRKLGREWFIAHTGIGGCNYCAGQLLRAKSRVSARTWRSRRASYVGDAIIARLCGRAAHDGTSLSIAGLYNPSLRAADAALLREIGIGEDRLPALISVRESAGGLLKEVANSTGLPPGIPLSAAVHDQYAAALGAGVIHAGDVMFGAGTAWVLLAATARLTRPVADAAYVCTHVVDGLYAQMLSMANGGSSFGWAANILGLKGKSRKEIDELLSSAPPGSDGLRFQPFLAPSKISGLPQGTRGRLTGLQLSHQPAHVLRAVVEGLACELARHLELLRRAGAPPKRLVMCGGAAASGVTPQIVADATALPVACAEESEMSALGAAVIARGLIEPKRRLDALSRAMTPPVRLFRPGADSPLYRRWFGEYMMSLPLVGQSRE